jgi:cell division protein FtsI (penicillin-binding protein 3)/stage V sporulation protein D (sporulation-specific penicillin-binding protein)
MHSRSPRKTSINPWKAYIIAGFILLLFCVIAGRLFFLQVMNGGIYQAQALGQQVSVTDVVGSRGQIFCQNTQSTDGNSFSGQTKTLALNKDQWTVSVNPNQISDKAAFAKKVDPYLQMSESDILSLLNNGMSYAVLTKTATTDQVNAMKAASGMQQVSFTDNPVRFYPQQSLAAQAIGFLGGQGTGQYGVEGYYDSILQGKSAVQEDSRGLNALFDGQDNNVSSVNGSDLYLTLDYNIQFEAEQLLAQAEKEYNITGGQIIVEKPDTGRIIALANYPSFDLNNYGKVADLNTFQDGAVQKLFEPGSIMKPFTMAAALDQGKITPNTTFVDTGSVQFGTQAVHNFDHEIHGKQTMTQVLEQSINTGAVFAEQQISHATFLNYLDKFGFSSPTGVDLQGESHTKNNALRGKSVPDINFATASYGQGIDVTPIEMVRAYSALANGGHLVRPYIVDKIVNGSDEQYTQPLLSAPVVSQQTLNSLRLMMIDTVDLGFNGYAKVPGYYMAGKTGTAQIPNPAGGGYLPDADTIQSFVGYPAYNPSFLILVKLDQPHVPLSALSAVPIYKQLAQYIINYWQIPPDYDASKPEPTPPMQ